jgi:hypothetical protein
MEGPSSRLLHHLIDNEHTKEIAFFKQPNERMLAALQAFKAVEVVRIKFFLSTTLGHLQR